MLSLVVDQEPPRETPPLRYAPRVPLAVLKELAAAIEEPSDDIDLPTVLRDDGLRRRIEAVAENEGAAAQASRLLLADLALFGWVPRVIDDEIWLHPPAVEPRDNESPEAFKRRQREAIQPLRLRQLREASVNAFLRKMETPRFHGGKRVSVLDLVDNGADLAAALQAVTQLPPSQRPAALERVVRPTVEVASPASLCPHTGLPTLEIWRYFRHTWSSEYRPTPGRSLFLLVRNAARPMAPVMGIACLANATLQLNVRDNWIGWTRPSIIGRLKRDPGCQGEVLAALLQTIRRARAEIRSSDLMAQAGRLKGEALERQLEQIASDALKRRKYLLTERRRLKEKNKDVAPLKSLPLYKNGTVDWRTASESPLFVAKRAGALADLLFAQRVLGRLSTHGLSIVRTLDEGGPEGTKLARALGIAAREVRKVGLASRLLELSVCGAVPPYRDLLAGKLTALVVASAEVADAYAARYQGQVSEIASQMAGKPVSRDASICVIMTTSLYGVIASQYNRLKLRLGEPRGAHLHWEEIGERTEGKGTAHISDETINALRELSTVRTKHQNVNNMFGEGQSPRLRQAREGLDHLKLDADVYLRHHMPRRVYGLELFPGARQTLCLNEAAAGGRVPLAEIVDGWRGRWLAPRILNRDVLARVGAVGPETVRAELTPPEIGPQRSLFPVVDNRSAEALSAGNTPERMIIMAKKSNPSFVQGLYRALHACADHHTAEDLDLLHIETPVESFIRDRAKGRVILVTGNPGDGKTHLLRRLEAALKVDKVEVILDANEAGDEELGERIAEAYGKRGRGLAVAINEGILAQLVRGADGQGWAAAARRQMLRPYVYRSEPPPLDERLYVVDLNLRNNLSPTVVRAALERLLRSSAPCSDCPRRGCELQENARRLTDVGHERLVALLDAVARSGVHATMRDLYAFLSFLLAPRTCRQIIGNPGAGPTYWNNAFEGGRGQVFEAVRRFDPQAHSAPILDDVLWRGVDRPEDWLLVGAEPAGTPLDPLLDHVAAFVSKKRRALFEHKRGLASLSSAQTPVDVELEELLKPGQSAVRRVARRLNRFFDRDDEEQNVLRLWVTHRYDVGTSRYAAAAAAAPVNDLELLVPRLHPGIEPAFPDYRPDHVLLCARGGSPEDGLRIDRSLIEALLDADRGLPISFHRGEPAVRVATFLDKLAKRYTDAAMEREAEVLLVDRDTGKNLRIGVDIDKRRYTDVKTR